MAYHVTRLWTCQNKPRLRCVEAWRYGAWNIRSRRDDGITSYMAATRCAICARQGKASASRLLVRIWCARSNIISLLPGYNALAYIAGCCAMELAAIPHVAWRHLSPRRDAGAAYRYARAGSKQAHCLGGYGSSICGIAYARCARLLGCLWGSCAAASRASLTSLLHNMRARSARSRSCR